jgi:hypothetical protein
MIALLCFFLTLFASPFKSKSRLEAENAALRHQLAVLRRKVRGRVRLTNGDRLFLVALYRWFPSVLKAITISGPRLSSAGIGDRDRVYGVAVMHRLRAMGIRDKPIAPCQPRGQDSPRHQPRRSSGRTADQI